MEGYKAQLLGGVALAALGAGLMMAPSGAFGQAAVPGGATVVQQSGINQLASTGVAQNTRTSCTTSQDSVANLTLTLTPNAGNFIYLTGFFANVAPNQTGSNSQVSWSTTNMPGNLGWMTAEVTATPGTPVAMSNIAEAYPAGVKATAVGTAVTIVPNATMASAFQCVKATWYQAPG